MRYLICFFYMSLFLSSAYAFEAAPPLSDRDVVEALGNIRGDIKGIKGDIKHLEAELKGDMKRLETALKGDMKRLETDLKGDIKGLKAELKGDIKGLKAELKGDMKRLETELKGDIKRLEGDIRQLAKDTGQRFDGFSADLDQLETRTNQRFDDFKEAVREELRGLRGLLYALLGGIFILIGFVLWDRRTTVAPVARDNKAIKEVLNKYSEKHPDLKEILRRVGLL